MLSRASRTVYLDNAATTPPAPEVVEAMCAWLGSDTLYANASSVNHQPGRTAAAAVARARADIAASLGARPDELVFTSGATEANNLALFGAARYRRDEGRHIGSVRTEHKAVLDPLKKLQSEGYEVSWLDTDASGRLSDGALARTIREDTILASIMLVNNETGVIQDIPAAAEICQKNDVSLHVDAAQAYGKLALDARRLGVDSLSVSAHKIYGPKGVGALFVRSEFAPRLEPILYGGGQERGLRAGTLAGHQIAGFQAAALALANDSGELARIRTLRARLLAGLFSLDGVCLNGHEDYCVPHIVNVSVTGVHGESLLHAMEPVALSSGSACNSASREPSYVLRALGRSDALAESSLRFGIGRFTTDEDIDEAVQQFRAAVTHLRASGDLLEDENS